MKWIVAALLAAASLRGAEILVASASDLAPLGSRLEQAFQKSTGDTLRFTFASSGSLARQIENGAPYDVFLSANEKYATDLAAAGKLDAASVVIYAQGRIALWSPHGAVRSLDDLKRADVKHLAIPNPEHAPYGIAARQALEQRGAWKDVEPKIVYGENVRQALQYAESGNAEAVNTSWTLLIGRGTLLPRQWHAPIRQAAGIVQASGQKAAAARLLKYLTSTEGRKFLEAGGLFAP